MASGEVVIQSMWSPAVAAVRAKGIPCTYQPLKEGYRSWGGGLGARLASQGAQLDAAYEYINWYTVGLGRRLPQPPGLLLGGARYRPRPIHDRGRMGLLDGRQARQGRHQERRTAQVVEKAGAVRDGGSFEERMGTVACWNAVMDEDRYMVQRWNEFIAA